MSPSDHVETFASIKWALPFLTSPAWSVHERMRPVPSGINPNADTFPRDTIASNDGTQERVELYQKPVPGSKHVTRAISLCKYGVGLMGFGSICHGGAVMTMMDDAIGFAMIANEASAAGVETEEWGSGDGVRVKKLMDDGKSLEEVLKGYLVTAHLEFKFLRPVLCPGIVGIEVTTVEHRVHKMRFVAVMKNGEGIPLVEAKGLFARVGGAAKI